MNSAQPLIRNISDTALWAAVYRARETERGMIFIPSIGGISHAPEEFSRPQDVVNGANVLLGNVLLGSVLQLDAQNW